MKTLTEFAAIHLKNAAKTRSELASSGKTVEELPQAMGEALKLEGDKLNFILNAIEVVGEKLEDLKRVVVFTAAEGEKTPPHAKKVGEHFFMAEYYPSLNPPKGRGRPEHGERGRGDRGKRGDKKGKGRGRRDGRGGERGGRADRPQHTTSPTETTAAGDASAPAKRERRPRKPLPPVGPPPPIAKMKSQIENEKKSQAASPTENPA